MTSVAVSFNLFRLKLSFRTLNDFDLNEAIDVYDFICINIVKFQFVKSRKLSDLCSKIYEKS